MVILGGLELVAAGYIIHKHAQNKKEKQRIEDEAAALEEYQYRIFPSDGRGRHSHSQHRRRRSHSRRRHSTDGKYRKESPRPPIPAVRPPVHTAVPAPMQMPLQRPSPYAQPQQRPSAMLQPQQRPSQPQLHAKYPPDVKYGWTDDAPARPPQQDPSFPPTGWPAHWEQSRTTGSQRSESSRGRQERRTESPHVRFEGMRDTSQSPPPQYRV